MKAFAILATTVLFVSSCVAEEIVAATSDGPPDAGHHPPQHPCTTNAECHPDEYCAKPNCQEQMGGCARRPIICNQEVEPVCGCDGFTYFNDCVRKSNRMASSTPGECDTTAVTCGGPTHAPCPPPSTCAALHRDPPMPMCPADAPFNCWVLPVQCGPDVPGELYNNWLSCGPPAACVNTCNAIRSGVPHYLATACP